VRQRALHACGSKGTKAGTTNRSATRTMLRLQGTAVGPIR
jgi:hypothetical protein